MNVPQPAAEEIAELLWDTTDGQLLKMPWSQVSGSIPAARFRRMANAVRALYAPRCCGSHGRTCEPPSELCCDQCSEASHRFPDAQRGEHADGSVCVNPDLSPVHLPLLEYTPYALIPDTQLQEPGTGPDQS